jgi:Domain of unknown function (DUF4388)
MGVTGCLTDFSLPEIFQFIEKGQKTGLLTIQVFPNAKIKPAKYYLWARQGRIVAAANRLDHQGLVSLIDGRQWISDRVFDKVVHWCCPIDQPLGLYLKNQGVLQSAQLKRLFQVQVLQQVCALFQLKDAEFKFEQNVQIPSREMTGLSVKATEATLVGLRVLRNWQALVDKLPDADSSLVTLIAGKPNYHLDSLEWQIWEYTHGTVSLQAIADQLILPTEKVKQVAFRLITIGLVEEVQVINCSLSQKTSESVSRRLIEASQRTTVSQSFMQNLVGFLRSKV